ncbi:SusC/RagA family TonB-linked outer membrane protein [Flexithrix dorotheae]|uniref:SusC/RagA family TonB-linked outer membrane protein n=1 Tax=Flexithrix dorotheae TaxID=70993 RepID=UPI0012F7FCA6|nr:SusC/RagA family TonB-linked outer membrane protein [Flexithrix dorotheae]
MGKILLSIVAFLVTFSVSFGQEGIVTGTVISKSDGNPLPGVSVVVKGTTTGTVTDIDGQYKLSVSQEAELEFSFVGFHNKIVPVGSQSVIDVSLEEDITQLDEIIVTGYGSQMKREVTGSISKVKSKDLSTFPAISVDQNLQGLASGVQVSSVNGVPGAPTRVMVRGTNSISTGTEPLWIIDGMVLSTPGELNGFSRNSSTSGQNPLAMINPGDIESVEVLKDAAATAIYGSRGANGVIIVTTKTGKSKTGTFNVNYQQGVSKVVRGPNEIGFTNGDQWLSLIDQARANSGLDPYDPNSILNNGRDPNAVLDRSQTTNTNWFDQVLRDGSFQDINISTSKGAEKSSYYISGQYRKDESVLNANTFERLSLRTNLDFSPVNNLDLGLRATFSYADNERAPNGGAPGGNSNMATPGYNAVNDFVFPWLPVYHPTATDLSGNPILFDPLSGRNPAASMNKNNYINDVTSFRAIAGVFADYQIPGVEGLKLHTEFAHDFYQTSNIEWGNTVIREGSNYAFDFSSTFQRTNYNVYFNYNKDFGTDHNISITAGTESTAENNRRRNTEADQLIGTAKEVGSPGNVQRVSNGLGGEIYFRGYFGRLNYKLKDKYLFGLSYRYDGSSVFDESKRWGSFPAVSAGWIISEEAFMSGSSFFNLLKLRGSYGQTGNSNISATAKLTSYATWGRYGDVGAGDLLTTIGNKDVTWETTSATDVGVDFEVLENRISGSIGYYHQNVTDMLYQVPIPVSSGIFSNTPTIWDNIGDMKNSGIEFSINAIVMNKNDFKWDLGFNFTTNKNKVVKLTGEDAELYDVRSNGMVTREGDRLSFFRLARYAGIHTEGGYELIEEMDLDLFNETGERVATGNLIPATRSNLQNHLFDNTEKTALPTYFGGFNSNFTYKGFDLGAYFSFSGGNYIFDNAQFSQTYIGNAGNILRSDMVNNTWTDQNKNATYPKLVWNARHDVINEDGTISENERFDPQRSGQRHDKYLQKGDYIRLRTLSLGYSLPKSVLESIHVQKLRVYVMANNLWTITGYDGYDPEVVSTDGDAQSRNINQGWVGVQIPQVKTFSFGVNLGF